MGLVRRLEFCFGSLADLCETLAIRPLSAISGHASWASTSKQAGAQWICWC